MEIQFLGTASGTPTRTRNVSALAVRASQSPSWHLVDCGEGTQHRLLQAGLSLVSLASIFITHVHGDHCYGLPGLLASAGMQGRSSSLCIVGPAAIRRFVEGVMDTTQLRLPYHLQFVEVETIQALDLPDDFQVAATALSHRVPSYAYSFTEKNVERKLDAAALKQRGVPAGPLWGRIERGETLRLDDGSTILAEDFLLPPRKPRKIIVGGDNDTPELLADEARTADVLIHEATYTSDVLARVGPGPQHSSAEQVARFAAAAHLGNLVLTHFSARYQEQGEPGLTLDDLAAAARAFYDGRLFLARDFERYQLDKQGVLSRLEE